ncbi:hypothetical protein [Psychromonas aquimarina]|uniref:hypothetical protein n=1 Tax=Psychromonas aquimarina TaxID=444919 RepID=UPI00042A2D46|nr:hypothetical protein [Psychromonas aquimarina]
MSNIHALNILPSQEVIDSIANYHAEFDDISFDYTQLLIKLKNEIYKLNFMVKHDNADWMQRRGSDYLTNPKLFAHAPLTYICAFIGELFKKYSLEELLEKLTPQILKSVLARLNDFKLH